MKFSQLLLVILLAGCNSSSEDKPVSGTTSVNTTPNVAPATETNENLPILDNSSKTEYSVLFMGNSHVTGLNSVVLKLLEKGTPLKTLGNLTTSSGGYLADRLADGRSLDILKNNSWTHIIFQAQKYSQSGIFDYPTDGAQAWIQLAKSQNATPILFPEHPQRNNSAEGRIVHDLHVSIAKQQSSCVAPVGLVWDRVLALRPRIELYATDGNHASHVGKFLTSLVFYEIISGQAADLLPYIENVQIDINTQDFMGQIVTEIIADNPPCKY